MLADAGTAALLAQVAVSPVLADAGTAALLAQVAVSPILAFGPLARFVKFSTVPPPCNLALRFPLKRSLLSFSLCQFKVHRKDKGFN